MKIRVGSRDSQLAVIQSKLIMEQIQRNNPQVEVELITMKTTGDLILDRTLDKVGGKGLFVKELDAALRRGDIDISVHSLKDLPMEVPEDLPLLAFSKREAGEDVLVYGKDGEPDWSKPIGSSSPRRNLQLKELYKEVDQKSVRGNVQTRLRKLDEGEYSALVLAKAGLLRLGLEDRISRTFTPEEMIPAAGQGILVVQGRKGELESVLSSINDKEAEIQARVERAFVTYLDGGCSSPIGAYAIIDGDDIHILGFFGQENGDEYFRGEISGRTEEGEKLAKKLAKELKEKMTHGK